MAADGSVIIDVNMDVDDAEKELAKLQKSIQKTEGELAKSKEKRAGIMAQLKDADKEASESYIKLEQLQKSLRQTMNLMSVNSSDPPGRIGPQQYIDTLESQKKIKEDLKEQEKIEKEKSKVAENLNRQYEEIIGKIQQQTDLLQKQKETAAQLSQNIDSAKESAHDMTPAISAADDKMKKFSNRIWGLVKRVFVFSVITAALRAIRNHLGKVIKKNKEANAAFAKLKGALLTLAQPIIEYLIPALIALANILTRIVTTIATIISSLFGKTIKQSEEAAKKLWEETEAFNGVGEAAEDAAGNLAGFDEINTIQTVPFETAGNSDKGIVPDFNIGSGISDRLKEIAKLVMLIGAGLALWKIGKKLPGVLGDIATSLGGILLTVGGLLLLWDGLKDAWENGINWLNLIEMVGGLAAAASGLYIAFGPVASGIALVVGGLALLITGFRDATKNGWTLENELTSISGILAAGLGISLITNSWIPLLIAGIAAALLALTIATGHGEELINGIQTVMEGFVDFFTGVFTGDIKQAVNGIIKIFDGLEISFFSIIDSIERLWLDFLNWLDEKTGGEFHGIIKFVENLIRAFHKFLENKIQALNEILSGLLLFLTGDFEGGWEKVWSGIKDLVFSHCTFIADLIDSIIGAVKDAWNAVVNFVTGSDQYAKRSGTFGGHGGKLRTSANISRSVATSIPALARGAVIPPNREFMAILGDQKSGTNIETPLSTMKQAFIEALQESGGNGKNGPIQVNLVVDGKVLAKVVVPQINNMTRQAGKSVLLY